MGLFGQVLLAGDGERGFGFGWGVLGLGAGEGEGVLAGEDGAVALVVDARKGAGIDGDGDYAALTGGDGDALKTGQGVDGTVFLRGLEIGFDDFVAAEGAAVGDGDGGAEAWGEGVAGFEGVGGELDGAVGEGGVTEAEAEAPEGFALEIAVGAGPG